MERLAVRAPEQPNTVRLSAGGSMISNPRQNKSRDLTDFAECGSQEEFLSGTILVWNHIFSGLNRVQFETDSRALGCVPHSSYMAIFP
jgi:hypothetical protein